MRPPPMHASWRPVGIKELGAGEPSWQLDPTRPHEADVDELQNAFGLVESALASVIAESLSGPWRRVVRWHRGAFAAAFMTTLQLWAIRL
eukprot:CAMPEP_0195640938 /NCGR_PEP_ID=MMETSP0815-20121206/26426_1 /TAXON_ID=97485 /ORGANISM="Prymnesium parvum, Strain Texoma1" /LENGTH=89 /DNA_ID=CAMNT_0040783661 /DNA_START=29 /DNA_END=295 /DNA_ORIENTATION=+